MTENSTHIASSSATNAPPHGDGLVQLVAACVRKERVAQRQLYDAYASFIYGIIRRYTRDDIAAQEIQSEAFFRILSKLDQYRFEGAFEGWMRRIAVHAIAEYFRRQKPAGVTLSEDMTDVAVHHDAGGLGSLGYQELLKLIHDLPTMQRTIFNLFVFEQYPHKEISSLLNITENNSRWHLNDARRRLKEQINALNR